MPHGHLNFWFQSSSYTPTVDQAILVLHRKTLLSDRRWACARHFPFSFIIHDAIKQYPHEILFASPSLAPGSAPRQGIKRLPSLTCFPFWVPSHFFPIKSELLSFDYKKRWIPPFFPRYARYLISLSLFFFISWFECLVYCCWKKFRCVCVVDKQP